MHTYSCTKGRKRLEPSRTEIHVHHTRHMHTVTDTYTSVRIQRRKGSHSIICVLELIGSVSLNLRMEHVMTMKRKTMSKRWSMLESVHCIVFFETWALNATSCVHSLCCASLCTPVRKRRDADAEHGLISLMIWEKQLDHKYDYFLTRKSLYLSFNFYTWSHSIFWFPWHKVTR